MRRLEEAGLRVRGVPHASLSVHSLKTMYHPACVCVCLCTHMCTRMTSCSADIGIDLRVCMCESLERSGGGV